MDQIETLRVFSRVARLQSFSGAARELRLSPSRVSRAVSALEERLGARLLERSTRNVRITELGTSYLETAEDILVQLDELDSLVGEGLVQVRGNLRVTAPTALGEEHLIPKLPKLLAQEPGLSLEVVLADRFVDLVAEGFDVAIRAGKLDDSNLIARRIGNLKLVAVASSSYLRRMGKPRRARDLAEHECIVDTNMRDTHWRFASGSGTEAVQVGGRLAVNSLQAAKEAALRGAGIALLPSFMLGSGRANKGLVRVLPERTHIEVGVFAVTPGTRRTTAKLRCLVDFLAEELGPVLQA